MRTTFLASILLSLSLCASAQERIYNDNIEELINRMEGAFDSGEQAAADSADYYNIVLHMKRIWNDRRSNGYYLYVEQAMERMADKPYRQRIYHITRKDNQTIESKVFEIPDPLRFAGAWNDPALLRKIPKDSLIDRQGCSIFLQMDADGNFHGSTPGKECLSSLRGATYATSEVVIYPSMLVSWDRGWDAADQQVWGATKGGYRFRKWEVNKMRRK
jgi:hypothetical protein